MQTMIESINGFRVWDSRGRPTVEVEVRLRGGACGTGMAPAGASRGRHEAVDLRDGGAVQGGYGVNRAVSNVNGDIRAALVGLDAADQARIDAILIELDGTPQLSRLGGNAVVATSMAVLKAASAAAGQPVWRHLSGGGPVSMPLPQIQIFGGGAHAGRRVDIQDFMVMPVAAHSFDEALSMCADIYRKAGDLMEQRGGRFGVADEGGWWPDFESNEQALEVLTSAIDQAGYGQGEALIALDVAASEFGRDGRYKLALDEREYDTAGWLEVVCAWVERYPIMSIEDPVGEDDAEGMQAFTRAMGRRLQIVGDDFLVTSAARVDAAAAQGCCNAVLVKANQAGTISQALATVKAAQRARWGTVVSARSGETEDTLIAHLAVGWSAGQLKVGSFARSERMAKWNECLRIERSGLVPAADGNLADRALPVPCRSVTA